MQDNTKAELAHQLDHLISVGVEAGLSPDDLAYTSILTYIDQARELTPDTEVILHHIYDRLDDVAWIITRCYDDDDEGDTRDETILNLMLSISQLVSKEDTPAQYDRTVEMLESIAMVCNRIYETDAYTALLSLVDHDDD